MQNEYLKQSNSNVDQSNAKKLNLILSRIEPYFFTFIVIISILPVICFKYFPTGDGAAHLYNSRLILELLRNNSVLANYFHFNDVSPNWFGHVFLVGLLTVVPAFIAEKILILFYLIGFPLAFRALIKALPNSNRIMVYFVFPFNYSFLFYTGMYNFHLGLVFFFWALALYVKYNQEYNLKRILILLLLSVLICLSHLFTFSMFILVIAILNLKYIKAITDSELRLGTIKKFGIQFIFLSVGVVLMLKFLLTSISNNQEELVYLNKSTLLNWLLDIQPAKGVNYGKAAIFTKWIFYSFILLLVYLIVFNLYNFLSRKTKINNTKLIFPKLEWFLCATICLILLFILPDGNAAFGFISSRFVLFFFLFLIIWLSIQKIPVWLAIPVFIVINYVSLALIKIYFISAQQASITINEIRMAGDNIKPNSVVLPLNYSDNLLFSHVSNYLAIDKPMVVLENYEAYLYYFPLGWNMRSMPQLLLDKQPAYFNCVTWPKNDSNTKKFIDYVFIIHDNGKDIPDQCSEKIKNLLSSGYALQYSNNDNTIQLYMHHF